MTDDTFLALMLDRDDDQVRASVRECKTSALPDGDVLVSIAYSSLNYKDGLAVTGQGKIVRTFPFIPGIDLAGTVVESTASDYQPGDDVVLTGWGVGERHWGGFAGMARVKAEWLVHLPPGLSLKQAMGLGTAGLTAMLCVMSLRDRGLAPGDGDVVVTGAAGGVGSVAVALLAGLGCNVVASTGRPDAHDYLQRLGARRFIEREVLASSSGKPLESERWIGAIDSVGGETLAGLLKSMRYGSSVAACGLAGGSDLRTTVFPFILRGVSLIGIDSVYCPVERRRDAWARLARELPVGALDEIVQVVSLRDIPELSRAILAGQVRGRVVVDVGA